MRAGPFRSEVSDLLTVGAQSEREVHATHSDHDVLGAVLVDVELALHEASRMSVRVDDKVALVLFGLPASCVAFQPPTPRCSTDVVSASSGSEAELVREGAHWSYALLKSRDLRVAVRCIPWSRLCGAEGRGAAVHEFVLQSRPCIALWWR